MMKTIFLVVLFLQAALISPLDISVKPEGISVNVGGKLFPNVSVDIKVPKELQVVKFDKIEIVDPNFLDVFKILSDRQYDKNGDETCTSVFRRMSLNLLPTVNACIQEMNLSGGHIRQKLKQLLPCMVRCVGTRMNVFKDDGTFNFDYTQEILTKGTLPSRLKEVVLDIFENCFQDVAEIKPNDPTCDSHRPVMKCVVDSAFKMSENIFQLCPDIPEVFKSVARRLIKSHRVRKLIDKVIEGKDD